MTDLTGLTLVVNPSSGRGASSLALPSLERRLRARLPEATIDVICEGSYDAARDALHQRVDSLAGSASAQHGVVVVGGDGMAHLGLNACAGTGIPLAVLPTGTGNDFCRGLGMVTTRNALDALFADERRTIDLLRITTSGPEAASSYVGCSLSTGFDAQVNARANETSVPLGALVYGYAAIAELLRFAPLRYRLVLDGQPERIIDSNIIALSNTAFVGGGMEVAPSSDPSDGLMEVTILHATSRIQLLKLLRRVYSGDILDHPDVEVCQARRVQIEGPTNPPMGDGEFLPGRLPATVEVAPGALHVFAPARPHWTGAHQGVPPI